MPAHRRAGCTPPSCARVPVAMGKLDPLHIHVWGGMRCRTSHHVGQSCSGHLLRAWHFVSLFFFPHVVCRTWSCLACRSQHTACPFSRLS